MARQAGFTLVELMVVIGIIGILAAIAIPSYLTAKEKAKEADVKGALHSVQISTEQYATDRDGNLPKYLIGGTPGINDNGHSAADPLIKEGYLTSYPRNPFMKNGQPILALQEREQDALRPGTSPGDKCGYRFGASGSIMGQIGAGWDVITNVGAASLGVKSKVAEYDPGYVEEMQSWKPPYLPGQFIYCHGLLVGFGGPKCAANKLQSERADSGGASGSQAESFDAALKELAFKYPSFSGDGVIIVLSTSRD